MQDFPDSTEVGNLPATAANPRDVGLIPESGRSPGEGVEIHSSILAWRIPWTEEPSGLQSRGSQRVGHDRVTENTYAHVLVHM